MLAHVGQLLLNAFEVREHRPFDEHLHRFAEFGHDPSDAFAVRAGFNPILVVAHRTVDERLEAALNVLVHFAFDFAKGASVEVEAVLADAGTESMLLLFLERLRGFVFLAAVVAKTPGKVEPMIGYGALRNGSWSGCAEGSEVLG